jgi:hypothetical protein
MADVKAFRQQRARDMLWTGQLAPRTTLHDNVFDHSPSQSI